MDMTDNPNYYFIERPYKSKYICTDCRKSFKRKLLADILIETGAEEKAPKCPDCGKPTHWIGPKFRAPQTENIQAWNSIGTLRKVGLLNFIGWANNDIKIPETKKALDDLLKSLKISYEASINKWVTRTYSQGNKDQIKYLSEIIKKIDQHLQG